MNKRSAEDEISANTSRFRLDEIGDHEGYERKNRSRNNQILGRRIRRRVADHGDEFVALAFMENIYARFGRAMTNGECSSSCLASECLDQVIDNALAVVIECLACTEPFYEVEIPWGGCCDYLIACCDGELDCIAADARRATPDEKGLAGRFGARNGWKLESEMVFLK